MTRYRESPTLRLESSLRMPTRTSTLGSASSGFCFSSDSELGQDPDVPLQTAFLLGGAPPFGHNAPVVAGCHSKMSGRGLPSMKLRGGHLSELTERTGEVCFWVPGLVSVVGGGNLVNPIGKWFLLLSKMVTGWASVGYPTTLLRTLVSLRRFPPDLS